MNKIETDIIVIGSGVAGLWLHHSLNDIGYHCTLIEKSYIGGKQTLSSQGIIHGGTKYALNGVLSGAASAIVDMPTRWLSCLNGSGDIDLSKTTIMSNHQLMWSTQSLSSKLVSFFSSKALSSRINTLEPSNFPDFFSHKNFKGNLYQLNEPVLDTKTLIENLSEKWQHRILSGTHITEYIKNQEGNVKSIKLDDNTEIRLQYIVLTAGEGNEALLKTLNLHSPKMQCRPLNMVLAKSASLPPLYAHCIGANTKPIATITSHQHSDGDTIWYIGGNIAEQGVGINDGTLITNTINTLNTIMPWFSTDNIEWGTHSINRAEPAKNNLTRPDTAFVEAHKNIITAWPTKLALTPNLSDKIVELLTQKIEPLNQQPTNDEILQSWQKKQPIKQSPTLWDSVIYHHA